MGRSIGGLNGDGEHLITVDYEEQFLTDEGNY